MPAPDLRAEIAGLFASLRRDIDERERRALELLEHAALPPSASDRPDWCSLKEAAGECGVHVDTMARQARAHGLGRRIDRVWNIDMRRVRAWREGKPYERLPQETWELSASTEAECGNVPDAGDGLSAPESSTERAEK